MLSASGTISSRGPGTVGADLQRQALEAEGVEVIVTHAGEMRVNLRHWGWFPTVGSVDVMQPAADDQNSHEREGNGDEDGEQHED